ncbi:hypothetical protein HanRHA438_Chr13g0623661 [Helianthus annuus]|nr:hypothetical protein HanRHA438_Chr13g0623661 [Helianthus annuus]
MYHVYVPRKKQKKNRVLLGHLFDIKLFFSLFLVYAHCSHSLSINSLILF